MIELARPAFPEDDGTADPLVRAMLRDEPDPMAQARRLRDARLLACVVAVADQVDAAGADKDSHMAVVSMVAADGRRGLLAFTGVDALREWDPQARPVPARGRDLARAALDEGAAAVVLDVAGPRTAVIEGAALVALAGVLDLARVEDVVRACLAGVEGAAPVAVRDARGEGRGVDVLVEVGGSGAAAAQALAARADLAELVPGGLGVVPPSVDPPA